MLTNLFLSFILPKKCLLSTFFIGPKEGHRPAGKLEITLQSSSAWPRDRDASLWDTKGGYQTLRVGGGKMRHLADEVCLRKGLEVARGTGQLGPAGRGGSK